jgi:PAS domain S-box-containing protein
MDTSMPVVNNRSGDVILVSIEKRSGVINGIWPKDARLHGVAGKRCIGKKIQSFLMPGSKAVFKNAISKKNKQPEAIIQLVFSTKKLPEATYDCSIWQAHKQPMVLMIHKSVQHTLVNGSESHIPKPTDLVEWEQAEKLVLAAESKFKRILEKITMPIAVYEAHEPKRFVFINPKFTEWLGYTIEDIPNIEAWSKAAYRDEAYFRRLQKVWQVELTKVYNGEKRESAPMETPLYCKDGSVKELEMSFTTDENLVFVTFNDVTEKNCILRALHENERKFRNISEQLPIPICVFSDTGETRFLNNAFIDTFGYTKQDIPTRKDWHRKAYPDETYRSLVMAAREQHNKQPPSETRTTLICQFEVVCKDGSKKHIEFTANTGDKLLYVVANDITGKVKAELQLKESHRQLRELSSYLENIREEERKHISREIHDELGQQLTLLKLDLMQMAKKLKPEEQEMIESMKQADQLLAETMRFVRKIATQLRPSILDNLGLVSALEWQSREFEKNFGIRCVFESLLNEPQFTTKQSNALFRIYQEALTNIARHAEATKVDAVLSQDENRFVLEIHDNGKGFNNDLTHKKTLGLKGMQERALMIDGDFCIESAPGQGTYIQISIPILITNQEISQL